MLENFKTGRCLAHDGYMHNDAIGPKCGGESLTFDWRRNVGYVYSNIGALRFRNGPGGG